MARHLKIHQALSDSFLEAIKGDAIANSKETKPGLSTKDILREMKKASKEKLFKDSKNAFNY